MLGVVILPGLKILVAAVVWFTLSTLTPHSDPQLNGAFLVIATALPTYMKYHSGKNWPGHVDTAKIIRLFIVSYHYCRFQTHRVRKPWFGGSLYQNRQASLGRDKLIYVNIHDIVISRDLDTWRGIPMNRGSFYGAETCYTMYWDSAGMPLFRV